MNEIYLAGGSFWGLQKYFDMIFGILKTEVGYINGQTSKTNYQKLAKTDHAEAIRIIYNPKVLSLETLLDYYYEIIDPTSLNKQGKDKGRQYRTGIYYTNKNEVPIIIKSLEILQKKYSNQIVIEVEHLKNFVRAENYHQNFLINNPFGYCQISREKFNKLKLKQYENISFRVMKNKETEKAYKNEYFNTFDPGIYVDKETNRPLFSSMDKYNEGYGWPTFYKSSFEEELESRLEVKNLKIMVEVMSKAGKNHLGYLFYDGPKGQRICINSASLRFVPKEDMIKEGFGAYLKFVE